MTDATTVVAAGYGAMAERYLDWTARVVGEPRRRFLDALGSRLPDGADVVDLGCGAGVPGTKTLARRHSVLGVDASAAQLRLARRHMPRARFAQGDLASVDFAAASLDVVTAFYSLTHVPRARHAALLARIAGWLRPAVAARHVQRVGSKRRNPGGLPRVPMYFSGFDADTNRRLVARAGFVPVLDEIVTMREPDGPATFLWIMAERTRPAGNAITGSPDR